MTYPGGKGNCYQKIINLIPPHDVYIEAFLGDGIVMKMKKSTKENIAVELHEMVLYDFEMPNGQVIQKYNVSAMNFLMDFMDGEWKGLEFVYCDPPYLRSTRKDLRPMYRYEMTDKQHIELLEVLIKLPCMVMISGYESSLYKDMLQGWNTVQYQNTTRQGMATEWLWMNYEKPSRLHDYRYLGADFRERERIQKKVKRWVNNLKRMPELERSAIISSIGSEYSL